MSETVDLDEYPDDVILKAFWLQRHIHKYGIEGIDFSGAAQEEAEDGDREVAAYISDRLILEL